MHKAVLLAVFLAAPAVSGPIYNDNAGKEWLFVAAGQAWSWTDIATNCEVVTGVCSGSRYSYSLQSDLDLEGYSWASRNEVRDLVYEASGAPAGSLDTYNATYAASNGYGLSLFDKLETTSASLGNPYSEFRVISGLTRDVFVVDGLLRANLVNLYSHDGTDPANLTTFDLDGQAAIDLREPYYGVFLYKQVPEPGSVALFALGLMGLGLSLRRHRRR